MVRVGEDDPLLCKGMGLVVVARLDRGNAAYLHDVSLRRFRSRMEGMVDQRPRHRDDVHSRMDDFQVEDVDGWEVRRARRESLRVLMIN